LGAWSPAGGTIHSAGWPSSFVASWPADTRSLRASRVTDERSHAYGSTVVRGERGAIRKGKGAESEGREEGEELQTVKKRDGASWTKAGAQGAGAAKH
jgi:hypothetical protein